MIKVVGIDPGLAGTGIGVIQGDCREILGYSFGSISTGPDQPLHFRLHSIYSRILSFFSDQHPDRVVLEDIYSLQKFPESGIVLGKVSGVILVAACQAGLEVDEVPVREVKKIISGNGRADKYQMERAIRSHLNHEGPIRPFHASDALGLALTGYYRYRNSL